MLLDGATAVNIATATTTQVVIGPCVLKRIVVNTTAAGAITIVDATSGTTPSKGIMQASILPGSYEFNMVMGSGIRIVTAGASDITVLYTV